MEVIETVFGVYTKESQGRLELTYDYEFAAIVAFRRICEKLGVRYLLDVGSNIGVYAVYCSDIEGLVRCYCFEPAPASYAMLLENVKLQHNRKKISVFQIAASNREGVVPFKIVSPTSGANKIAEGVRGEGVIDVKAAEVDRIVDLRGETIGVKIDVEGHELSALEGMKETLSANQGYLQLEALSVEKMRLVTDFLGALGYRKVFSLRDDHLFLSDGLADHSAAVLEEISRAVSNDLLLLMHLRREKRAIARAAHQLRRLAGYAKDPLFLPVDSNPFSQ